MGLAGAIRFLNTLTPYQYTGVYGYDDDMLINLLIVDKFLPEAEFGEDLILSHTYCQHLKTTKVLQFVDPTDFREETMSPVKSYSGVLIADEKGEPFGSLCHFDLKRCQASESDIELLQAAAPMVFKTLRGTS